MFRMVTTSEVSLLSLIRILIGKIQRYVFVLGLGRVCHAYPRLPVIRFRIVEVLKTDADTA